MTPETKGPTLDTAILTDIAEHNRSALAMDAAGAEATAHRVMLHLYRGSITQARAALEDGWQSHVAEQQPLPAGAQLLEVPLSRIIDDVRLLNSLEKLDVITIEELLEITSDELLSTRNMGDVAVTRIANLQAVLRRRVKAE